MIECQICAPYSMRKMKSVTVKDVLLTSNCQGVPGITHAFLEEKVNYLNNLIYEKKTMKQKHSNHINERNKYI